MRPAIRKVATIAKIVMPMQPIDSTMSVAGSRTFVSFATRTSTWKEEEVGNGLKGGNVHLCAAGVFSP